MENAGAQASMAVSSKGRSIVQQDYRKLAGMEDEVDEIDKKSHTSRKSTKSQRSVRTNRIKKDKDKDKQNDGNIVIICHSGDMDSRAGDFVVEDMDEEVMSLGSDASRLHKLQQQIDDSGVTFAEKYNEYKVKQGHQDRLEDSELPENLHDERHL